MKRLHRAWAVCLGCTFMLLICGGLGINAFSVSQPYILSQNGFTNTQTSMIVTVRSVTYLLSMFAVTLYYRKLGYRLGLTPQRCWASRSRSLPSRPVFGATIWPQRWPVLPLASDPWSRPRS